MRILTTALFLLAFSSLALAAQPKVGDTVWAQWKPNAWYHGKVDKTCDYGLHVQFDDGDKGCFHASLIAVDKPVAVADVKPGLRVMAKWSNNKLYPATVTGMPDGDNVKVFFDDRTPFTTTVKDLRAIGK